MFFCLFYFEDFFTYLFGNLLDYEEMDKNVHIYSIKVVIVCIRIQTKSTFISLRMLFLDLKRFVTDQIYVSAFDFFYYWFISSILQNKKNIDIYMSRDKMIKNCRKYQNPKLIIWIEIQCNFCFMKVRKRLNSLLYFLKNKYKFKNN